MITGVRLPATSTEMPWPSAAKVVKAEGVTAISVRGGKARFICSVRISRKMLPE